MKTLIALVTMSSLLLVACLPIGRSDPTIILTPQLHLVWPKDADRAPWTVQIDRPHADQLRNSSRVLVRKDGSRLQVYPDIRWLDSTPTMLQALMIEAFADSGRFVAVGRPGNLRAEYSLVAELSHFELVDDGSAALSVHLGWRASLMELRSGHPIAARRFEHRQAVGGLSIELFVAAFETALEAMLNEMVDWAAAAGPGLVAVEGVGQYQ